MDKKFMKCRYCEHERPYTWKDSALKWSLYLNPGAWIILGTIMIYSKIKYGDWHWWRKGGL